ncbi:MAG: DNA repair protein [Candidatus Limivicinus sp.]|nr:DNA repair protein [Candidatus Limivicinus sp.]
MTDKELRGLSRRELLELLVAREKENQQLRQELDDARAELNKRQIDVTKAGTMAEAALLLNGIFDAADRAALQYLENIRLRAEGTNK